MNKIINSINSINKIKSIFNSITSNKFNKFIKSYLSGNFNSNVTLKTSHCTQSQNQINLLIFVCLQKILTYLKNLTQILQICPVSFYLGSQHHQKIYRRKK